MVLRLNQMRFHPSYQPEVMCRLRKQKKKTNKAATDEQHPSNWQLRHVFPQQRGACHEMGGARLSGETKARKHKLRHGQFCLKEDEKSRPQGDRWAWPCDLAVPKNSCFLKLYNEGLVTGCPTTTLLLDEPFWEHFGKGGVKQTNFRPSLEVYLDSCNYYHCWV